jgi:hypothetical protein
LTFFKEREKERASERSARKKERHPYMSYKVKIMLFHEEKVKIKMSWKYVFLPSSVNSIKSIKEG